MEKSVDSSAIDVTGRVGINLVSYYRVTPFNLEKDLAYTKKKALWIWWREKWIWN